MFGKRKDAFFETFEAIVENIQEASELFAQEVRKMKEPLQFADSVKKLEKKGDHLTHKIYQLLNKTFITPIEREDIMALGSRLDDVLDGIEACVSRFDMYQMNEPDEIVIRFADNIRESVEEIVKAIRLLSSKKLLDMQKHTFRINELENEADELLRSGVKALFLNVKDPIELIKKKEIYETLETTTDCTEDVANILESIIMRNS